MPEQMTVDKDYLESLEKDRRFLDCLRAAGVDNWQGYDFAWELYREENDEDE